MCVCGDEGTFMLVIKTVSLSPMCSVVVWEAPCLLHALQLPSNMQFDNVDFALDLKITTDVFHHHRVYVTKFEQVISTYGRVSLPHISQTLRSSLIHDKQLR